MNSVFFQKTLLLKPFSILLVLLSIAIPMKGQDIKTENIVTTKKLIFCSKQKVEIKTGKCVSLSSINTTGKIKGLKATSIKDSKITDFARMTNSVELHNAEKQLSIDMQVIHPEEGKTMTVMLLKNPYKSRLVYKIKIYDVVQGKYVKYKSQPVIPGLTSIVTWPFEVSSVMLYNFKVSAEE